MNDYNLWTDASTDVDDKPHNNRFSFGCNGSHSGQYIASKLEHRNNILIEKENGYFRATDCEGNMVGFPDRGLEPCEYKHIRSTVRRLWGIVLCLAAMVGFVGMILSAI